MEDTAVLTPGAHRVIRLLDGHETAYPGELITDGDRRGVRMDACTVPEPLWEFGTAEHVAGVRDVLRRSDGHDALLPWCTDRMDAFLGRRTAADAPLTPGEIVTLVGSLLRGIVELGDSDVTGQWWLTDEARPLFAPGEGAGCAESAVAMIDRLAAAGTDRAMDRLLSEIARAAGDRRVVQRQIERWERELTDLAAPKPLQRDVGGSEHVTAPQLPPLVPRLRLPVRSDDVADHRLRRVRDVWDRAQASVRRVGVRVRERVPWRARMAGVATHSTGHGDADRSPGRGRMLLVGAAAAGVVLLGGVMWPAADGDSAATMEPPGVQAGAASRSSGDAAGASGEPLPPRTDGERDPNDDPADAREPGGERGSGEGQQEDGGDTDSLEGRAAALLVAIAECAKRSDISCANAVAEGAGQLVHDRLAGAEPTRPVSAVEDYGDVAVLRLGPSGDRGEQMLVLVAHNDGWLVRDVYDVADQPSDQS